MSPTPVTFSSPTEPASYSWEATDEQVAARYGVPLESIVRFDLNTSPAPPAVAERVLEAGRFDGALSDYPASDYGALVATAAGAYGVAADELLVGAGADEILELCAKAFLAAGDVAVAPVPTYAMYRVVTEQRGGRFVGVPRRGRDDGWAADPDALAALARETGARLVWLCSPNNPTGLREPEGAIERLLGALSADAAAAGAIPAAVVLDEAYAEFVDRSLVDLRADYPALVTVRTASKAYALAGLRVGFALARAETIARVAPFRPPASVGVVSATVVRAALADGAAMRENVRTLTAERARLAAALEAAGWSVDPSETNFLLVEFESPSRAAETAEAMLRRGLVPRTFPVDHPLAHALRITVRSRADDDRLIELASSDHSRQAASMPTR